MSAFARIGRKDLRILRDIAAGQPFAPGGVIARAVNAADAALTLSPKKKSSRSSARKSKQEARAEKNEETSAVRGPVFKRATPPMWGQPVCEICGHREATDLQHVFGRTGEEQTVETCLALCRRCHEGFTNPESGAGEWLLMATALERLGFVPEASKARARMQFCQTRADLQVATFRKAGAL